MIKCDLQKDGKCVCSHKCAKIIWYEKGRCEATKELMEKVSETDMSDMDWNFMVEQAEKIGGYKWTTEK